MAKDPVCGREIDETAAREVSGQTAYGANEVDPGQGTRRFHNGTWYYFCTVECRSAFMASPDTYATTT